MRVTIHGFRCYSHKVFEFKDNANNRIYAASGEGKSTIFQAITWCLYGNLRNTSTRGCDKNPMWVMIEHNGIVVKRERNPVLLSYRDRQGVVYKGPSAQSCIDVEFGNSNMWYATSYIEQGGSNYLVTSPAAARMAVLREMVFMRDDPKKYQDKIRDEIKKVGVDLQVSQQQLTSSINTFNSYLQCNAVDVSNLKSQQEINSLSSQLLDFNKKIEATTEKCRQVSMLESKRQVLSRNISRLESQLAALPQVDQKLVEEDSARIGLYQKYQTLLHDSKKATSNLRAFGAEPPEVDLSRYTELCQHNRIYQENLAKATKIGVPYDKEVIARGIDKITREIELQPLLDQAQAYNAALTQYNQLAQRVFTNVGTQERLNEIPAEIRMMEISRDVIKCPSCDSDLRYQCGGLVKANGGNLYDQNKINSLRREMDDCRAYLSHQVQLEAAKKNLDRLPNPTIPRGSTKKNVYQLHQTLSYLKTIVFVDKPPVSIEEADKRKTWVALKKEAVDAQERLSTMDEVKPVDISRINRLVSSIEERRCVVAEIAYNKSQLDNLQVPDQSSIDLSGAIQECKNMIDTIKTTINKSNVAQTASNYHARMTYLNSLVQAHRHNFSKLDELRVLAIDVECQCLQKIVDNINHFLEVEAEDIFTDPITLMVSLYKTGKTTGVEKSEVNLQVLYKGSESTDLKSYSGGERERFNILITLALQRVCGNGILIFDESLSCLDEVSKEKCLELINRVSLNTTVMIVDHNSPVGDNHLIEIN